MEYIIQDGGSSAEVINLLRQWESIIKERCAGTRCLNVTFKWISEPDQGMYDAISRGFEDSSGEIMAWINTDDFYLPGTFQAVSDIFDEFPHIDWISGIPAIANDVGNIVFFRELHTRYNQKCMAAGYHHRINRRHGYNWIQQDCVFWRRKLWDKVGGFDKPFKKYAGDYFLWKRFAQESEMIKVQACLSAFRIHGGQLTCSPVPYETEIGKVPSPSTGLLLYNLFQTWSGQYPMLNKVPSAVRRAAAYALLKVFHIPNTYVANSVISWHAETHRWILHKHP